MKWAFGVGLGDSLSGDFVESCREDFKAEQNRGPDRQELREISLGRGCSNSKVKEEMVFPLAPGMVILKLWEK